MGPDGRPSMRTRGPGGYQATPTRLASARSPRTTSFGLLDIGRIEEHRPGGEITVGPRGGGWRRGRRGRGSGSHPGEGQSLQIRVVHASSVGVDQGLVGVAYLHETLGRSAVGVGMHRLCEPTVGTTDLARVGITWYVENRVVVLFRFRGHVLANLLAATGVHRCRRAVDERGWVTLVVSAAPRAPLE